MKINLMLGGDKPKNFPRSEVWAAVDGGLNYLLEENIEPIVVYGDFDTYTLKNNKINLLVDKKESQELTDSEYAIDKLIEQYPNLKEIVIYAATGGRIDHLLANIMLLSKYRDKSIKISICDDYNYIFVINSGRNILKKYIEYKYISFLPVFSNTKLTIRGAKYNCSELVLTNYRANATSNEFLEEDIEVNNNNACLVVYSKDKVV